MAEFERTMYEFWREVNPVPYHYDESYEAKQQTTRAMVMLRLGWLLSNLPKNEDVRSFRCVDIGGGTGIFTHIAKNVFKECFSYDIVPETSQISTEVLRGTDWDVAFSFDSLEHYDDINDLFKVSARYHYVSFPETPEVAHYEELQNWRHYKPGEHLWCLHRLGVCEWFEDKGYQILAASHIEDAIRTPWDKDKPNITSILARRAGVKYSSKSITNP